MNTLLLITLIIPFISAVPIPEQVHIALGKTPDVMVINWVTMEPSNAPKVQYGPESLLLTASGTTNDFIYNGVHRYMHTVTLTNLKQATIYYYKVGTSESWSKQFQFKTFEFGNNFQFRVCIFGDLGYVNGTSIPYLNAAAENGEFDMVIHIGDIAYDLHTNNGERGDLYMKELEPLFSRVPYMVIAGNHEDDGRNFSHYQNRFTMPNYDNQFYSFDVGPVHFVGISTEYYGFFYEYGHLPVLNQYQWLKTDLNKANENHKNTPWIVSFQHRPFYCSNENSFECRAFENRLIRIGYEEMPGLEPILNQYNVDLGYWGHEHSYERFYPVNNRIVYNTTDNPYHNAPAPTYIVSGSAGCHTPKAAFGEPNPASAARYEDFGYTLMTIYNHTHIQIQQISVEKCLTEKDNCKQPIDETWLTKDPGFRMSQSKNSKGIKFPESKYSTKCSFRDSTCRREAELIRAIRSGGFVL